MCVICDSLAANVAAVTAADGVAANHPLGPLVGALVLGSSWSNTTITYRFTPAGEATYAGSYTGGSPTTSGWSAAQMDFVRAAFAHVSSFIGLTFVEVSYTVAHNISFQSVAEVPGGWAGYAFYPRNALGSTVVVGEAYIDPAGGITLIHEIGHALGLAHTHDGAATFPGVFGPGDPGDFGLNTELFSTMSYRGPQDPMNPGLLINGDSPNFAAIDIAALQSIYGANTTHAAGNTVYGLTGALQAIWDAGGIDSIDFSASGLDAVIDLRAASLAVAEGGGGYLSFVRSLTNWGAEQAVGGYTIANGVVIENAVSGSGNDRLQGNAAANQLTGGLGNDSLYGDAGNDVLRGAAEGQALTTLLLAQMNSPTVRNQALSLADYAEMPGTLTLDCVLQLDPGVTHAQRLVSYAPDTSTAIDFELQLWDSTYPYLYLITRAGYSLSTVWTGISRTMIADGTVHRLTVSRDAASGEYRVYLDGSYTGGGTDRPGEAFSEGGSLVFGQSRRGWGGANDPAYAIEGAIGDIAVYNSALSDAEIAARSVTALADPGDGRLVTYWRPAVGSATMVDETGGAALSLTNGVAVSATFLDSDNDSLVGGAGNDMLIGAVGRDTLVGGTGNDIYVTDGVDTITEALNQGTDTVQSTVNLTLGANLENLALIGGARNGVGNGLWPMR